MLKTYKIEFLSLTSPIRAYTIFGAICWAYKLLHGEERLTNFLKDFKENPKFLISTPYPIIQGYENNKFEDYFLFPKPIIPITAKFKPNEKVDICIKKERKKYKKAKYITEDLLKDFIKGSIKEEKTLIEKEEYKVCGKLLIYKSPKDIEFKSKSKSDILTKNVINRITSTSDNLYTEEGTFLDKQFFLIKYIDNSFYDEFKDLIKIIKELGLGKNKNVGWGKIKIKEIPEKFNWLNSYINNSDKFITLSPVIPTQNISLENSYYDFEIYKSPVENSFWKYKLKQKVIYLKEGSLISSNKNGYKGQLKQVVKEPEIYQYGLEFPIRVEG